MEPSRIDTTTTHHPRRRHAEPRAQTQPHRARQGPLERLASDVDERDESHLIRGYD